MATMPNLPSIVIYHQPRQNDLAISNVAVDAFGREILAGLIQLLRLDRSIFPQFADDMVALRIRVRVRGVGDLKCKASKGQAGVPGAGSYPQSAFIVRRALVFCQKSAAPQVSWTRVRLKAQNRM